MSMNKRLPRRKPIDYSIMREAPFYDGLLTKEDKARAREDKQLWDCVLTAHYTRKLYVANVKPSEITMVDVEGFPVLNIRRRASGKIKLTVAVEAHDPAHCTQEITETENVSRAISVIAHGRRSRGAYGNDFGDFVHSFDGDPAPQSRSRHLVSMLCANLVREYDLRPKFIDLNATAYTWAARVSVGDVSVLDIPADIRESISKGVASYNAETSEKSALFEQLRSGLGRSKWVIGVADDTTNDMEIIVGKFDMTVVCDTLEQYYRCLVPYYNLPDDVEFNAQIPFRLYKSLNSLPEDMKASIVPRLMALNVRRGTPQHGWSKTLFCENEYGCQYLDEIDTLVASSYRGRLSWYIIND